MAYPKVKGSIILKLIIVVLALVLVYVIYIPSNIWNIEEGEKLECRFRLKSLIEAQTLYLKFNEIYADSIEKIIDLAITDSIFATQLDSLMRVVSRADSAELAKIGKPMRLYFNVPISVDSLFRCPSTGEYYIIISDDPAKYIIDCPVPLEGRTLIIRKFLGQTIFKKIFINHGYVNQNKETSW